MVTVQRAEAEGARPYEATPRIEGRGLVAWAPACWWPGQRGGGYRVEGRPDDALHVGTADELTELGVDSDAHTIHLGTVGHRTVTTVDQPPGPPVRGVLPVGPDFAWC